MRFIQEWLSSLSLKEELPSPFLGAPLLMECRYVQTSYRTVPLISMAPTGNKLVPSPNPNP